MSLTSVLRTVQTNSDCLIQRYPEVQKVETDFFLAHYDSLKRKERFKRAMSDLILNHPGRAEQLLIPLMTRLSDAHGN